MTKSEAAEYLITHCDPDYPKITGTEWNLAMHRAIETLLAVPGSCETCRYYESTGGNLCELTNTFCSRNPGEYRPKNCPFNKED